MSSVTETASDSATRNPQSEVQADQIQQGDCVELLAGLPDESVDLAFADPPYNIGFKYDEYQDNHADEVYLQWCESWIEQLHRVVKPTGAFWLAIGDEYAAELKVAAQRIGFTARNWVVWYYTFGQNCRRKFNRSHAHLFHFVKDEELHTFNAADPKLRIPSARALVYGDRRANPTGRLPDDTWIIPPTAEVASSEAPGAGSAADSDPQEPPTPSNFVLRPQDLRDEATAFHPQDDTWYFSRVAGTFKERQGFHGCQMPEQLLGRIVRASSSEGELVLDPFAGSGTTLAVAKKLGRHWLGFELSTDYVKYATERIEGVSMRDPLHGPADPVRSSPTTAKGRKLKGHPMADAAAENEQSQQHQRPEPTPSPAETPAAHAPGSAPTIRELTRLALIDSFHASADGASLDWLLCRPELQQAFHLACDEAGLLGSAYEWNRQLLKLRKSGELKKTATAKRATTPDPESLKPELCGFAAEIAWAKVRAKHAGASLDDILCDPEKLDLFDKAARKAAPGAPTHAYRWAALRLRKAAKNLKAEAVQYEFVVRKLVEQMATRRLKKLSARAAKALDGESGVYLISTASKSSVGLVGYVGEADDLGVRLATHPLGGGLHFAAITDDALPSDAYRHALRWNLTHRLQPTLSLDLMVEGIAL